MTETVSARPKVLIIDDNPAIVDVIRHSLLMHGVYEPLIAMNGEEGLEKITTERPACVIIDVMMPRLNGYQLVRCLRGDEETANIALIILTALAREQDRAVGVMSGADEFITKPFQRSALLAAIDRALHVTPEERLQRMERFLATEEPPANGAAL